MKTDTHILECSHCGTPHDPSDKLVLDDNWNYPDPLCQRCDKIEFEMLMNLFEEAQAIDTRNHKGVSREQAVREVGLEHVLGEDFAREVAVGVLGWKV